MRFRSFAFLALAASSLVHAQYPGSKEPPKEFAAGFRSISVDDCRKWLGYLAGPECEGRGTGQTGFQKAADYVAARFKEFGLKPVGDNETYFQGVPFVRSRVDARESYIEVAGKKVSLASGFSAGLSADFTGSGVLTFIKVAGTEAALPDDTSLTGRIVIVNGKDISRNLRRQLSQGTKAVLFVNPGFKEANWSVRRGQGSGRAATRMQGEISSEAAKSVAEAVGVDVSMVDASPSTTAVDLRESAAASLIAKVITENTTVPNVVGVIEGTDPVLKNEVVGLGAHLDHLGVQNGVVYWGADDDGSGSTALLAVAKAFSKNPVKPKRTVLFMAFCGEEMGLIGSGHYANNPLFPLDKMTCELQMDMVGRNEQKEDEKPEDNVDTIHLVGSKRISTELHELVLAVNAHINFKFEYDEEGVYTRSDHYMFAQKGVPIAFLFSGFHPDYHQPSDTIDKINFEKIANTARLFYLTAQMAANRPEMLKRDVGK